MKITRLEAENFLRLIAVSIAPDGNAIVLGGNNGAGKTSVLSSIEAALGGGKHLPDEPIRKGQKKARVVVETEELVVTRTFTPKGSQLEVKAKDGSVYPSPQALLDGLVGKLSFDPLVFTRQDAKAQAATLRQLVGLDFAAEDKAHAEAFEKRTDVGREIRRIQGALDKMPEVPAGTPDAEMSVADLLAEADRREMVNRTNEAQRRELGDLRDDAKGIAHQIAQLQARLTEINDRGVALKAEVEKLVDADVAEVRGRIANAEKNNAAARAARDRAHLEAELNKQIEVSEALTQRLTEIDGVKADAAAKAKYPIEGLAVTDTGVTLNGVPFEQASQAEKLRASVAIGLALNQKLRVILIRDGALLDSNSLRIVAEMAEKADAQVWLETVGDRSEVTILIEDGAVAEDRTEHKDSGRQPATGVA